MANVPEAQQIVAEEFKEDDQELASKIAAPFNSYTEQLNEILNQNLTFADNMRGVVKTMTLVGGEELKFKYGRDDKPIGMWLVSARNLSSPGTTLSAAPFLEWEYDGKGNITIKSTPGLTTDESYQVTFIIISG